MMSKKMRKGLTAGLALVAGLALAVSARASTTYSYFYKADQNSYTVAPGNNLTVNLFLQEVNSDGSTNSLLADEHGLSYAGVSVQMFSGSNQTTITSASPNTGIPPTGFDDPSSTATVNANSATITENTDGVPFGSDIVGVEAGPQVNGVSQVFLGTVTIHASSVPGQTTVFTAGVANPDFGSTLTNDSAYDLDDNSDPLNPAGSGTLYSSAAPTNFRITTTPEPTSLALFALAALALTKRPGREGR